MSGRKVIELVGKPVQREAFKKKESEVSLGDRNTFTHSLYFGAEEVGFDGGMCTVVRLEEDGTYYIQCIVSMVLQDGTIHTQPLIEEIEEKFPLRPPRPFYSAITGGTGAYRGARGEVYLDPASPDIHYYTVYIDETVD